ncbi:hypothetical protein HYDPIDRAFT_114861 [Hydnomerulius pinastri MD-312]|uniref:Uncharacterized protein n=1 Tax=Hydnomerulius pinastri MD-312 TaxID=994086 RepID=A0A0C9WDB7_9AGAM|nr:hypothetical protein HYDPIDRAFT_114861 [Hydnomerulius pinastri MD-312]
MQSSSISRMPREPRTSRSRVGLLKVTTPPVATGATLIVAVAQESDMDWQVRRQPGDQLVFALVESSTFNPGLTAPLPQLENPVNYLRKRRGGKPSS